jgi:hypothetical protein
MRFIGKAQNPKYTDFFAIFPTNWWANRSAITFHALVT